MIKLYDTQPKEIPILDNQLPSLPQDVVFCRRCVTSNQRPRIIFDDEGICSACRWAEEKETMVDWATREKELAELLDRHRSSDGSYDVIVPSSGGKDSGFVAHQLKHKWGMHPLTVTWTPFLYTDIGRRNWDNFVHAGYDNIFFAPNGLLHRKLSRVAMEANGDAWDPFAWGQKAFAFHMAVKFNIPLIFYGENGEVEYGGSVKNKNKPFEDVSDWKEFYFRGNGVRELAQMGLEHGYLEEQDVASTDFSIYTHPDPQIIDNLGVQMHWYSYYHKWTPQENYYCAVENTGFEANPERTEGTYTKYASLDDRTDGFHFWLGYVKFGMGRTTRDASMEVRSHHITREEAVALVNRYDGEFPKRYFQDFLAYLDMPEERFWAVADEFRLPHLWERRGGEWALKHKVENL